jgi:nucleoside-diphosphate-sugar epimerase
MSKILITGSSGFIGTNLLQFYESKGNMVVNIDKTFPKMDKYLRNWKRVNILDYDSLKTEILSFLPDFVIHLAARTDLNGKNLSDYESNTTGTHNLIKVLNQTPSVKRVIFTSSMLVCKPGYVPIHQVDYAPTTLYGKSKVLMEEIIRESSLNFEWAIVRPTSIWGPWFSEPYRNFFKLVLEGRFFHIGTKSCTKTYGYIENLVYQIDSILNGPVEKIQGKVFYLGDYEPTNIHNWADQIASQLEIKIRTIPYQLIKIAALGGDVLKSLGLNFPMTSFRLKNMTTNNVVDLSNTKEIAPFLPCSRIDGIKKTIDWLNFKNESLHNNYNL